MGPVIALLLRKPCKLRVLKRLVSSYYYLVLFFVANDGEMGANFFFMVI